MGLDMYLQRVKKGSGLTKEELEANEELLWTNNKDGVIEKYRDYIVPSKYGYDTFFGDVYYWRKANEIHNWFVENVQNGEDDCYRYLVSKEQIEELLNLCKDVLEWVTDLRNGKSFIENYEEQGKKYMDTFLEDAENAIFEIDSTNAEEKLPTKQGFFFGSYDYDMYYIYDVGCTYVELGEIIKDFDFDTYDLYYSSSW